MSDETKYCGDCKYFVRRTNELTGKPNRGDSSGRCSWKPNIEWSLALRINTFGGLGPILYPSTVHKYTNANSCKCFETKDKPKKTKKPKNLTEDLGLL